MDVMYLAGLVARWRPRRRPEPDRPAVVRIDERVAVVPGWIVSVEVAEFSDSGQWVVQIVTVLGQRVDVTYGTRKNMLAAYESILAAIESRGPLDAHR